MRRRESLGLCLALCAHRSVRAQPDAPSGLWSIELGPDDNRTRIVLEIVRADDGRVLAYYSNTLLNFHRMALQALEPEGSHWVARAFGIRVHAVSDDELEAEGLSDKPLRLRRIGRAPPPPRDERAPAGPAPRWQLRLGGALFAPVAVQGDTGYVGSADGVFHAIDLRDGARRWSFATGKPIHGEALVDGDAVCFVCDDGRLYRLSATDGRELWRHELGDQRVPRVLPNPFVFDYDHHGPRPLRVDDLLVVGAGDGGVHAVDAASGRLRWRFQAKGKVRASAARLGAHVVVGTRERTLHVLDAASGREVERREVGGPVTSSALALGDDRYVVGHRGGKLAAWRVGDSTPLWEQDYWGAWVESSAVASADGREAYIGSGDLFLVSAFDTATGGNRWRCRVGGWVLQRPLLMPTLLAVGVSGARRRPAHFVEQRGGVALIDRATGRLVWHWNAPTSPGSFMFGMVAAPALSGSDLVVGGVDGSVYAFALAG